MIGERKGGERSLEKEGGKEERETGRKVIGDWIKSEIFADCGRRNRALWGETAEGRGRDKINEMITRERNKRGDFSEGRE